MKKVTIIIIDDNDNEMTVINGKTRNVYMQTSLFKNEMGVAINMHEVKKEINGKKIMKIINKWKKDNKIT